MVNTKWSQWSLKQRGSAALEAGLKSPKCSTRGKRFPHPCSSCAQGPWHTKNCYFFQISRNLGTRAHVRSRWENILFRRHVHLSLMYLSISVSKFWTWPLLKLWRLLVTVGRKGGARSGSASQALGSDGPRGSRAPTCNEGALNCKSPVTDKKIPWQWRIAVQGLNCSLCLLTSQQATSDW